ncbi:MAG: hypothetical protein C4524_08900 [Candidatus Zixiibacteriota bacterium]|nr:MAG: hypothetical protein C4524_08900 [candidate division Zixibacteria bacterium]
MPKKKKKHGEPENAERWLLTYADLITLLLGLFVILYSMSRMDLEKYKTMGQALRTAFVGEPGLPAPGMGDGPYEDVEGGCYPDTSECYLTLRLEEALEGLEMEAGEVMVEIEERGVVVRLMETLMFDLGRAELRPEARDLLGRIAPVLAQSGRPLLIEGHTDNLPIATAAFPSNWQLSAARSANVVHFLTRYGGLPEEQISAAAYADQRPVASNLTEEGRRRNRRVDVVFLKGQWRSIHQGQGLARLGEDSP